MTKHIRIENADTSNYKVTVMVQELAWDYNSETMGTEWKTIKELELNHPTSMATEYITSTRRIIIEERGV